MKTHTLPALICLSLLAPSLFGQTDVSASPPIPEEARKHFVMGSAIFKVAKTRNEFLQAANEFKQAADLVPQWPEARYNLALAKEGAGDYTGALAELKHYQQHFKLSDSDARAAQDEVYAVEAKAGVAAQEQAAEQQAAAEASALRAKATEEKRRASEPHFEGSWRLTGGVYTITRNLSGIYQISGDGDQIVSVSVNGRNLHFVEESVAIAHQRLTYDLTLSSDSNVLEGTLSDYYYSSRKTANFPCHGVRSQ